MLFMRSASFSSVQTLYVMNHLFHQTEHAAAAAAAAAAVAAAAAAVAAAAEAAAAQTHSRIKNI